MRHAKSVRGTWDVWKAREAYVRHGRCEAVEQPESGVRTNVTRHSHGNEWEGGREREREREREGRTEGEREGERERWRE